MSHARHGASLAASGTGRAKHLAAEGSVAARRIAVDRTKAARGWTAPQMERAACMFDDQIAPRISGVIHNTASWMEPPRRRSNKIRNIAFGVMASFAVIGVAAMAAQYRRNQLADLLEPAEGLEFETRYREETEMGSDGRLSSTYTATSGYTDNGTGVGRGSGTGSSRGVGGTSGPDHGLGH
ncbi:hypothetical protein GCM10027589_15620 [Actinocorallia lasiicapitis]